MDELQVKDEPMHTSMCFINDIPENHGISSRDILDFLEEAEAAADVNLTNFMLLSHKYLLAEFCKKPYEKHCRQLLFSVTKSFTSLAVGIAMDKGYFKLDDKVVSFFSDKLPEVISENLRKIYLSLLIFLSHSGRHVLWELLLVAWV